MNEFSKPYRNFPKERADIILKDWKEYKDLFGLEGKAYFDEYGERRSEIEREKIIKEIRDFRKSNISDWVETRTNINNT